MSEKISTHEDGMQVTRREGRLVKTISAGNPPTETYISYYNSEDGCILSATSSPYPYLKLSKDNSPEDDDDTPNIVSPPSPQ